MSVYIWSDLHLGHANILKYEKRPFSDVDQMNKGLLESWRSTVKSKDTIINLGDVFFRGNKEAVTKIIQNLPGHKILVMGNHDRGRSVRWWLDVGFDEVYKYPIIYEKFYILSHEDLYISQDMPYVNVHGHTHSTSTDHPQKVNVSVEVINYKPILFSDIISKYDKDYLQHNK